jgi:hypothetical protein
MNNGVCTVTCKAKGNCLEVGRVYKILEEMCSEILVHFLDWAEKL